MSVFSGPNVVDDGLVFYYDISNFQKSWKGRPTTNLAASNFFSGNNNFTVNENITDRMPDGSTGVARLLNAQTVFDPNRTVSIGSYSLTAGETYTLSFYVRNINCTGFSGNLYSPTLLRVIGNITYPTLSANAWTRVITTFTVPNEGPNPVTLSPQVFRDGGFGIFKMCWLQMELGSAASQYVNGARSNTQAVLDLTNKNTITATSLTYASDGTFSFNESNSLTVPFNPSLFTFNNEQTVIIWMKNEASVAARRNPYNQAYGGGGTITHENNTNFNYYYGTAGTNNTPYTSHTSPFSVIFNEVAQIAITRNISQTVWYKNGTLGDTRANPYGGTVVTGTSPILIGTGYTTGVIGSLYAVQVYNRALSAAEIQQNFNATRGRYGI